MPSYAKFLKDFFNKRILEYEIVALTEECSVLIQNKLPPKLEDSGIFFPSFHVIGIVSFDPAFCDLGASVNLMPLFMSKNL